MSNIAAELIKNITYVIDGTEMGYTSLIFFLGLLFFLGIYYLLKNQTAKRLWLLAASIIFYLWVGGVAGFAIILVTALTVYMAGRRMEDIYAGYEEEKKNLTPKEQGLLLGSYKKRTKRCLWAAICLILLTWIYVKAGKLLSFDTVKAFTDFNLFKSVIVPLGISYYSLSAIGYLLDIYWRKTKPEYSFLTLFSVMIYFPHIVQGPISKYQKLLNQMNSLPTFDYQRVSFGFQLMLWGYIQKMVIADRLALYTNTVFAAPAEFAGLEILLAVILCVFQLYADFNGCMDIVRGISQAIGIELEENFKQPLFSKNVAEFWRRWHITLGAWMKEYIYMPISSNSKFIRKVFGLKKEGYKKAATFLQIALPTFVVWLLTGLWHGTGMDYVVWGIYWCVLIVLSSQLKPYTDHLEMKFHIRKDGKSFRIWQSLRTCILFGIGRTFTVTGGLKGCSILWKSLFSQARLWTLFDESLYDHGLDQKDFNVAVIGILIILLVDFCHEKNIRIRERLASFPLPCRWMVYYAAILSIIILGIYGSGYDASSFIYGAF